MAGQTANPPERLPIALPPSQVKQAASEVHRANLHYVLVYPHEALEQHNAGQAAAHLVCS